MGNAIQTSLVYADFSRRKSDPDIIVNSDTTNNQQKTIEKIPNITQQENTIIRERKQLEEWLCLSNSW